MSVGVLKKGDDLDARSHRYRFGDFTLDVGRGAVLKAGEEIRLRPKVYEALRYLVERRGQLVTKQELMQAVWPDSVVTDDSLVQCALELRRALEDRDQKLVKTVPRRGYIFSAEVREAPPESSRTAPGSGFESGTAPDVQTARMPRKANQVPTPRTALVGREGELRDIAELLLRPDVRLLTLTGPGGAGKSRLAIAVATAIAERFSGGVQLVSLASITDPDLVPTALADALGIRQVSNRSVAELIAEYIASTGQFLLVLDNFEQVLPAAVVVAEVLEACSSLKILVTSRSRLRLYGEQECPVKALPQDSAVELFVQRASAVWPDFSLTPENESAIREVCLRLDGLPLAIELAAARIKMLSPAVILDRLQNRLQLLTGGPLDSPDRQQTLRKTIDWSYGLLNEGERSLFRRLAAFIGGCTLEGAEAVCNTSRDLGVEVLEGMTSLLDKNLIQRVDGGDGEPRFAMLETMREYALERLVESEEHQGVRRAHAAYSLVLAEEGNPELAPAERSRWLAQCDAEVDNFRFALDWLCENLETDWALRLTMALFRFWDMREHVTEGRNRLEAALRLAGADRVKERAKMSHFAGALATAQGDYTAAEHFLENSLSLYEDLGDEKGIAASLNALAVSARDRGDYAAAQSNFERSLACWRMLSDRLAIARCLNNLANVVRVRGDYPRAQWALQEAEELFRQVGDRTGAAWCVNQLGDLARERGDVEKAREAYERALAIFRESKDPWGCARSLTDLAYVDAAQERFDAAHEENREAMRIFAGLANRRGIARALECSACLALAEGHAERALKLAAAAAHLRCSVSAHLHQVEQLKLDQLLLPAWKLLTEAEGQRAWAEGTALSVDDAIEYCLNARTVAAS